MKVCAGTSLVQFDSSGRSQIALVETFIQSTVIVNILGSTAILINAGLYSSGKILDISVYPEHANTQAYINYIVIGY